ncbi:hypothetical protein cyc_04534 [Cyclospora cayetanensis]|uniref:Uncharacterized protein n=1 Tax=Cyclospora cayetanensis TaxID=88456 RepID=A0A1D3CXK5_9EIME|nr:hypothetical protein cyc_04534 [Cyclospora cayetanensis]
MGSSASRQKTISPGDLVWLAKKPFIEVSGNDRAEITLVVDTGCCARIVLIDDRTGEQLAIDVVLLQGEARKILVEGLMPGSIYRILFLFRHDQGSRCRWLMNVRKKTEQTGVRIYFDTPEEKKQLEKVAAWPLFPMRQPGDFPTFYEVRTPPKLW